MQTELTEAGVLAQLEVLRVWLAGSEFATGDIIDGVFVESTWSGYERYPLNPGIVIGTSSTYLAAQVSIPGPSSGDPVVITAVAVIDGDEVITHLGREPLGISIPVNAIQRWTASFSI